MQSSNNNFRRISFDIEFSPEGTCILYPKCFCQAKVQRGEYSTLKDLKDDADLMCKNCMVYNSDDTIFYKVGNLVLKHR
jgi:hypothetical protein